MKPFFQALQLISILIIAMLIAFFILSASSFGLYRLLYYHLVPPIVIQIILVIALLASLPIGFLMYKWFGGSDKKISLIWTFFAFAIFLLTLFLIELYCYEDMQRPGFHRNVCLLNQYQPHFNQVDMFVADSLGINHANPAYFKENKPEIPINSSGFRGRNFTDSCQQGARIMLIGDSFVWGLSAKPITNSFADLLDKEYCIYNTGMTGAGFGQYKAIAKKYLPIIQPDITCLIVYEGNDLQVAYRKPRPGIPLYFWNKHMGIPSEVPVGCDSVVRFNHAEEAYRFYIKYYSLYEKDKILLHLLAKTNIGTQAYCALYPPFNKYNCAAPAPNNMNPHIVEIWQMAQAYNTKFLVFIIPHKSQVPLDTASFNRLYAADLKGIRFFLPTHLTPDDYVSGGDEHLNNQGHKKFARFIKDHLDK